MNPEKELRDKKCLNAAKKKKLLGTKSICQSVVVFEKSPSNFSENVPFLKFIKSLGFIQLFNRKQDQTKGTLSPILMVQAAKWNI